MSQRNSPSPLSQLWQDYRERPQELGSLQTLLQTNHKHALPSLVDKADFISLVEQQLSNEQLYSVARFRTCIEWLKQRSGRNSSILKPNSFQTLKGMPFILFLEMIKRQLLVNIQDVLTPRFRTGEVPSNGVILVFTDDLTSAYLVAYSFVDTPPTIEIVDRISAPRALFDLTHYPNLSSQRAKNVAKLCLTSGHKLLLQGGILTHVDRRLDKEVFGPTIDTVAMANEVTKIKPERVLEIGSGNGHIISSIASLTSSKQIVFADINPSAAACTLRNLQANLSVHRPSFDKDGNCYGIIGRFDRALFSGKKFDLVVSNPPYIATFPDTPTRMNDGAIAVTGVDLMREILAGADDLLATDGTILLMTSSTSLQAAKCALPDGFSIQPAPSIEVPFDVEAVLDNDAWLRKLIDLGALRKEGDYYYHDLIPIWIRRS